VGTHACPNHQRSRVLHVSTSLVFLPLAVFSNFVGIWLIKVVPTAQFFRITYVLLFVLGSVLFCQGAAHMLRETSLFDLVLNNPARMSTNLAYLFSQSGAL
jgi:uncharacterized membrane protein YfcA